MCQEISKSITVMGIYLKTKWKQKYDLKTVTFLLKKSSEVKSTIS
jgi:hypothetical protein